MDPFNGRSARQGVVCGCIKERYLSVFLRIQTPDVLGISFMLFLLSLVAVKTICKCHPRHHRQNVVDWFKNRDIHRSACLKTNIILMGYALVHCGFEILLKICCRFPFQPETVNEWFTKALAKDGGEEHKHFNVMNVDKTGVKSKKYHIQNNATFPDSLSEANNKVFFHGTSHEHAKNIIENGINLEDGDEELDFSSGDGFYLNDKFNEALDWAQRKQNPAVLIYRFKNVDLENKNKLDCIGQRNKKTWQKVILEFRSGNPSRSFLRNIVGEVDYIEGPMATWPPRNKYEKENPRPKPDSYQLCVRSTDLADAFDRHLHSVLFLEK